MVQGRAHMDVTLVLRLNEGDCHPLMEELTLIRYAQSRSSQLRRTSAANFGYG